MSTLINITKLCDDRKVRIFLNRENKDRLNKRIKELKIKEISFKEIASKLQIKYLTLWEYLNNKDSVPIEVFVKLGVEVSKNTILEAGPMKNRAKIPSGLNEDICKIIGAIIADGHLKCRSTKWSNNLNAKHYEIRLREEYKTSVNCFCAWIKKTFKIRIQAKKRKNHYEIF